MLWSGWRFLFEASFPHSNALEVLEWISDFGGDTDTCCFMVLDGLGQFQSRFFTWFSENARWVL